MDDDYIFGKDEEKPADAQNPPAPPVLITPDMLERPEPGPVDFERGMSAAPKITLLLIFSNVVIFLWEVITGALDSREAIIAAGALYRPLVLEGEVWRLFTAIFLHSSFDHLLGNCIMLYILGMAIEHAYSKLRMALIYLAAGLCGSCLSLAMSPGPSVGASGAIFGLAGAAGTMFYMYRKHFELRNKRIGIVIVIYAIYAIGTGFLSLYIDNFAHIGGFVGGIGMALIIPISLVSPGGGQEMDFSLQQGFHH